MKNFAHTVNKLPMNEGVFLNSLRGHIAQSGIESQRASIKTGYSIGEGETTIRDRNYNTVGTGDTTMRSDSYTLYDNPFDIFLKHENNKTWGGYKGRIKVSMVTDFFEQEGSRNVHYYDYHISGYVEWETNKTLTWIIVGCVIGLGVLIGASTGLVGPFFLIAIIAGIAHRIYANSEGKKYLNDIKNRIDYSLYNYVQY